MNQGKLSGWYGVIIGLSLAVVLLIPGIDLFLRLAVALLGAALFVEGTGRIRVALGRRQPGRQARILELPDDLPPKAYELGSLKAVFHTANRWAAALAVGCLGLAFASGELALVNWLKEGDVPAKGVVAALVAPLLAIYLLYRAALILLGSQHVLIFTAGLACIRGRRTDVYPWEWTNETLFQTIGDAIDEYAVEIRLKFGLPPLRFTCCQLDNLYGFRHRLQHERPRPVAAGAPYKQAVTRSSFSP